MHIRAGDIVKLRDGQRIYVTDAVDQSASEVIENPDNIILGFYIDSTEGIGPQRAITNSDEVLSINE